MNDNESQKAIERVLLSTRAAQIGTWDFDIINKTVIWDEAMYRLHGISSEDFNGAYEAWIATIHPEDMPRINKELELAIKGKKEFDTEFRIVWPDKSVHYIRAIALVQRDSTGYALRMVGTNWDITDSKIAEQKLENINKELNIFLDTIDEIFFSVDMIHSKVIRISHACEKLYGYTPEEFYSNYLFWFELIHPEDKHIVENEGHLLQAGIQVNNQYRVICKDQTIKWVETKIIPSVDEYGVLLRVDGVTRDITERKKAEEELRRSQELYRKIVETAQEGIWMIDESNRTIFVNQKMCEMLGYTVSEMMGKENLYFKDEEGKKLVLEQIERRKKGIYENHDSTYITKSGKKVWGSVSTNPLYDENGKYTGALAMITDITKRKADEESLQKSEANLRTILNNTSVAYIQVDPYFTVVSFNEPAIKITEEFFGKALTEGSNALSYYSDERKPFIKEVMARLIRGELVQYEISYLNAQKATKWYDVRYAPIRGEDKGDLGYILSMTDITESKLAAIEREKITADLIQRNKDLEQFTYIVSHNLRAPVANIIGLSDILLENNVDEQEKHDVLTGLSESVEILDTVIMDMNHILQVREQLNERKELVYFQKLVDEIKMSINNTIVKENVVFECNFNGIDHIFTIRSYLYSIFYNLILNSIKYRRAEINPIIRISTEADSNKIGIMLGDNGKGIDMDKHAASLFGLYKRFDTSVEGKGMGLFIVKTQVEAIGGTISVNSKNGDGTEFLIELPAE